MLYQLSYASPSRPETTPKNSAETKSRPESASGHTPTSHTAAQKSRLAHPRHRSKPGLGGPITLAGKTLLAMAS